MENCHIKIIVFAFLLTLSGSLVAQNLVNNPSFEEYSQCPSVNYFKADLAIGWSIPNNTTPDYFHSCGSPSTPYFGTGGYLVPHSGEAFIGMNILAITPTNVEYVSTKLKTKLKSKTRYVSGFYCCLYNGHSDSIYQINLAVNNLGMYFSDSALYHSDCCSNIELDAQIENDSINPLIGRFNWMLVVDTFEANGTEEYITIGNFNSINNSDTVILDHNPFNIQGSYYLIDDVFVIPLDSLTSIKEPKPIQGKAYNANGQLVLELEESYKPINLSLSNATGQTVWQHQEFYTQGERRYGLPPLAGGLYFVEVRCRGGVMREKVVIGEP